MTSKEEAAKMHELHRDILSFVATKAHPEMDTLSVAMSAMMTAVAIAKSIGAEHELEEMLDVCKGSPLDKTHNYVRPRDGMLS